MGASGAVETGCKMAVQEGDSKMKGSTESGARVPRSNPLLGRAALGRLLHPPMLPFLRHLGNWSHNSIWLGRLVMGIR